METPAPDQRLYLPELFAVRARANQRRALAFTDLPLSVLGVRIRPLTPRSWSMLLAIDSPFARGGTVDGIHVLDFLWIHSPVYRSTAATGWRLAKAWALLPALWRLARPVHRALGLGGNADLALAALALATVEIRDLVAEAFADAPDRKAKPAAPVATLEAFLVHEFATEYGWAPDAVAAMPLARLIQLHKCLRLSRGEEPTDAEENEVLAAHLKKRNAAAVAARLEKAGA
jgi:hypothetical protein